MGSVHVSLRELTGGALADMLYIETLNVDGCENFDWQCNGLVSLEALMHESSVSVVNFELHCISVGKCNISLHICQRPQTDSHIH